MLVPGSDIKVFLAPRCPLGRKCHSTLCDWSKKRALLWITIWSQGLSHIFFLIETVKANDLEPFAYLKYIFAVLPHVKSTSQYRDLLP